MKKYAERLRKENEQLKKQLDDKEKTFLKENVEIHKITKEEIKDYDDLDYCLITMEQFMEFKDIVKDFKILKQEKQELIEYLEKQLQYYNKYDDSIEYSVYTEILNKLKGDE